MSAATDRLMDLLGLFGTPLVQLRMGNSFTPEHKEALLAARTCLLEEHMCIEKELEELAIRKHVLEGYKKNLETFFG